MKGETYGATVPAREKRDPAATPPMHSLPPTPLLGWDRAARSS